MDAKHTPGPWYAFGRLVFKDYGDVRYQIAEVNDCTMEQGADASLIAAAPELLDALHNLLHEAESLLAGYSREREADGWDSVNEEPCFTQARAAIAKATGDA